MNFLKRALFIYFVLCLFSFGYRSYLGFEYEAELDQEVALVDVSPEFSMDGEYVQLAFREFNSDAEDPVPLVLLHGNPLAGEAMLPLAEALPQDRLILIPDLPGFGASGRNLKSFSAIAQSVVLLKWLNDKGVTNFHLAAYSQSGPLALELAQQAPDRVLSTAFIATVGLQEFELLGRYDLNQPIYRIYQGVLWSLRWLTPHFGFFDQAVFATTTARNFADTDLRRTRAAFERHQQPSLILHSVEDVMVPYSAAKAHATLLPQAVFKDLPGGHLGVFSHSERYAADLADFLQSVETGSVWDREWAERSGAAPASGMGQYSSDQLFMKSLLIGVLLFLFVFVSEDLSCLAGGLLAAAGSVGLSTAIAACFLGIWISDLLLYATGSVFGSRALRLRVFRSATNSNRFERLKKAYGENGLKVVFATRFIPGSRVVAYLTAGSLRLGWFRFSFWLVVAAGVWTPMFVSLAYWLGQPLVDWWEAYGLMVLPLLLLAAVLLHFGLRAILLSLTWKGRRRLKGRWIRSTKWEFWPMFPVYFPVLIYGVWLAIKYRSPKVWATCNPGMQPISGLAMESKSEILSNLDNRSGKLAKWTRIESMALLSKRVERIRAFQLELNEPWPLVLKPDIGQRGEGVAILRSDGEVLHYLERNPELVMAQAYAGGLEFGVFYTRHPDSQSGCLFSITHKVLPELVGDGSCDLETLILRDDRAVAMADFYFTANAERLSWIPRDGESVKLVELGTHCRGAIFLDANDYKTQALSKALDEVLLSYEGFCFGRFDLRVPSVEDLMLGQNLQILELNGVSSESTDIYDPQHSIFHAWRVLCRQWAVAFELGAANRARGVEVPRFRDIFRVLREHRARKPFEVYD